MTLDQTMTDTPSERRECIRIRERLVAFVKDPATGKVHRGLTNNISSVGVCVVTEQFFKPGAPLEVEIKLPDREAPVTFTGEVVWSRVAEEAQKVYEGPTVELGIKFVQIDLRDLTLIQQHAALNALPE